MAFLQESKDKIINDNNRQNSNNIKDLNHTNIELHHACITIYIKPSAQQPQNARCAFSGFTQVLLNST